MKNNKKLIIIIVGLLIVCLGLAVFFMVSEDEDKKPLSDNPESQKEVTLENDDTTESEDADVIESEEASYEEWLAAGVVTAISINYPDFEIKEILLASETKLADSSDSKGVFVSFVSGGETIVIRSKPLSEERTKAGTIDLHTQNLGYATFDVVDAERIKDKDYTAVDINQLGTLISQSMLVSLYEHY